VLMAKTKEQQVKEEASIKEEKKEIKTESDS